MGRKRSRRRLQPRRTPTIARGLPRSTAARLDELRDAGLSAAQVKEALDLWDRYMRIPGGPRRLEKDPSDEDMGERSRAVLDAAVEELPEGAAKPLKRLIIEMDKRFLATTVPDPSVPTTRPWWQRRDWF